MNRARSPGRTARRRLQVFRVTVLVLTGAFFVVPLLAMLDFSTRLLNADGRTGAAWKLLVTDPSLRGAILSSLLLSLLTVLGMLVLLVPTLIWVRLRAPWLARWVEFLCLLPLTVPPLVVIVGLTNVTAWLSYLFGDTPNWLAFLYVVLVLPYAYRALDTGLAAIDVPTLAEAARSLGAGWFTVVVRVVVPNLTSALISASFISIALVLGEYTFASLLNFDTLQVAITQQSKSNAQGAVATSLAAILFAAALLVGLSFFSGGRRGRRTVSAALTPTPVDPPTTVNSPGAPR
ncbi:MAG: ABC transporter, permease protein 2 (cluster 1, maltose/g3p/polyamine/iron) [uncultured Friedmanniella sp.]|uniref:ABC transporter, permease protein 2 (Cluster 1, maltose/g3p/polyamine/iron) n=1 Tax=uncultured Friedmanniella sp. TaxID=335381 RepID=A0A6J4LDH2_9ACTN|nr:ABC transporter permease subunit [uncultured Friedmanniella sp.]CAA9328813.1 MAG: ABC transporter, permease protein 2 (cluster 1, maltose/g3p/polyamine/iron) [uncultured Friedmanniella sp.]